MVENACLAAFVGAGRRSLAIPGDRRPAQMKAAPAFVGEARESGSFQAYPQKTQKDHLMEPWNKGKNLPAEPLTVDEVRALTGGCSNRAPTGVRNVALIVTLYRGGLRISEALSLNCTLGD